MKILYSAGNRPGAGLQLKRFLSNSKKHVVRIAAYATATKYISYIDWTLDALQTRNSFKKGRLNALFGHTGVPNIDLDNAIKLLDDLVDWSPDIVISDGEPIVAHAAQTLEIALWYCSPLHLLDGIVWEHSKSLYKNTLDKAMLQLKAMPVAERYLVCSPFGDVTMRPMLADGFEWVMPYVEKPNRFMSANDLRLQKPGLKRFRDHFYSGHFCTGETNFISDAMYNGNPIYISPSLDNTEELLNALFAEQYGIGVDLGCVDDDKYAIRCIQNTPPLPALSLSVQNYPTLHERLEEICI